MELTARFKACARVVTAGAALLLAGAANASMVTADLEDATNGGGFFAKVIFEDIGADTVKVTADIADPINVGLTQGDVLGLWMHIADESKLSGLAASNFDPAGLTTTLCTGANSVTSCGSNNNNLNGTGASAFDIGLALGVQGGAEGFVQTWMFELSSSGLTAADFAEQQIGMRVQSIDSPTFGLGASSKLIGGSTSSTGNGGGGINVPEPGVLALIGVGLLGGLLTGRRRKMAQ